MKKLIIIVGFLLVYNAFGQIPQTGLVAYFPFTGNANDSSGKGTHGTANNVTLVSDRFGNPNSAYDFSGATNSFIAFPSTNVKNYTFTWSLWAKITQTPADPSYQMLLEMGENLINKLNERGRQDMVRFAASEVAAAEASAKAASLASGFLPRKRSIG